VVVCLLQYVNIVQNPFICSDVCPGNLASSVNTTSSTMVAGLESKLLQLQEELKCYKDVETQIREQLKQSNTSRSELTQSLDEVCRRERETIAKLANVGKRLDRLRRTSGTQKQLTVINQKKFCLEMDSLREQLTEATEKLRVTETVVMATKSREIQEIQESEKLSVELGDLTEVWERMGIKHTMSVDQGLFATSFTINLMGVTYRFSFRFINRVVLYFLGPTIKTKNSQYFRSTDREQRTFFAITAPQLYIALKHVFTIIHRKVLVTLSGHTAHSPYSKPTAVIILAVG